MSLGRKAGCAAVACALFVTGAAAPTAVAQKPKLCSPGQQPSPKPGFKPGSCKRSSSAQQFSVAVYGSYTSVYRRLAA